jgi:ATP-dependent helicase/nuclease subunit A
MELTLEQKIASSFDRNLSVTANAGSGKTKVLVDRFVDILEHSIKLSSNSDGKISPCKDPSEIVAITFTKKAASEMKDKINRELHKRTESENDNSGYTRKIFLTELRNKMIYANISTIHSFCHKLMKDYPIEAEIIPNFGEISPAEMSEIVQQIIKEFLFEKTSSTFIDDLDENLEKLIFLFGKNTLIEYLTFLVSDEYELKKLKNFYDLHGHELESLVEESYINKYKDRIESLIPSLEEFFDAFVNVDVFKKYKDSIDASFMNFSILKKISIDGFDSMHNALKAIEGLKQSSFITKDYRLHGNSFRATNKHINVPHYNSLLECIPDIIKIKESIENHHLNSYSIQYSIQMVDFAIQILERINEFKDSNGRYTFDDMMIKALKVLSDESVIEDISMKIKYLMIDEFQDTNDLQYEIVKKLITKLSEKASPNNINLFIVGDTKQSIYAFRKADVRVFNKAMKDIAYSNSDLNENSGEKFYSINEIINQTNPKIIAGNLTLKTTFRLQPVLGAFLNNFFKGIMVKNESDYSVDYEDFVIGRNSEKENPGELGSVNFLFNLLSTPNDANEVIVKDVETENDESTEETIAPDESKMIAKKILQIVNTPFEKNKYLIEKDGIKQNAKFSDIFVLSRKIKNLDLLANELRTYNIPYVMHSGAGFYSAPEIKDLICYLNFIVNQNDDISLLSVLKSKFFEFSDNELLVISSISTENVFFEKLKQFIENIDSNKIDLNSCDEAKIIFAYDFLSESVSLAPSMSIQSIIRRLVESTYYLAKFDKDNRFHQINANIEKIIAYSRDFENPGFRTMYDFIDEVNFNMENEVKDNEAVVLTGENAVNLMSIHASKGLDSAVVFVIDVNSTVNNRAPNIIKDDTIGLAFKVPTLENKYIELKKTPIYDFALNNYSQNNSFEELRLLYVSLTRAKDHLFVSSSIKFNSEGKFSPKGFLKVISQSFTKNFGLEFETFIKNNSLPSINKTTSLEMFSNGKNFTINDFAYNINFEFGAIIGDFSEALNHFVGLTNVKFIFDKVKMMFYDEYISSTKYSTYLHGEEEFYKKYIYSLDEKKYETRLSLSIEDPSTQRLEISKVKGIALHYLFENITKWLTKNIEIDSKIQRMLLQEKFQDELLLDESLINSILFEVKNTVKTEFLQNNINNMHEWMHEKEFAIPVQRDFVIGFIDVLMKNKNGDIEIWDWKSNRIFNTSNLIEKAQPYGVQMKIYCYFLSLMYPDQEKYSARLLFTNAAKPFAKDEDWTYSFEWTKDELKEFEVEFLTKIEKMKELYI